MIVTVDRSTEGTLYVNNLGRAIVICSLALTQDNDKFISATGTIHIKDHDLADGETIMQEAQSSQNAELEIERVRHPIVFQPGGSNAVRTIQVLAP